MAYKPSIITPGGTGPTAPLGSLPKSSDSHFKSKAPVFIGILVVIGAVIALFAWSSDPNRRAAREMFQAEKNSDPGASLVALQTVDISRVTDQDIKDHLEYLKECTDLIRKTGIEKDDGAVAFLLKSLWTGVVEASTEQSAQVRRVLALIQMPGAAIREKRLRKRYGF